MRPTYLPPKSMSVANKQSHTTRTRIFCVLYLCTVSFIIIRDIPHGTVNPLNSIVIIYVVLFNTVLAFNIARLAIKRIVFTAFNALYIAALVGIFMAAATREARGIPEMVFGLSILYIAVYTVVVAVRGVWTGRA